jgi:pSer/pThr/pTyr-binding forkhead associated (FHA) protein
MIDSSIFELPIQAQDAAGQEFYRDCGYTARYELGVTNLRTKELQIIPLTKPNCLIGRNRGCDLTLMHRDISFRHCYLQVFGDRVLVSDLGSRVGTRWDGERRKFGWLRPGRSIQIACYTIKLLKGHESYPTTTDSTLSISEVLDDYSDYPQASLELLSHKTYSRTGKLIMIDPGVTFIGRSRAPKIRLKHESVSHIHAACVLTSGGLWIVDLLGRGGTMVNGSPVEFARLQWKDVVNIGAFHMMVDYGISKPVKGIIKAQRKDVAQSGSSNMLPRSEESEHSLQDSDDEMISFKPGSSFKVDPHENDEAARWSEIIGALKAGGFGE